MGQALHGQASEKGLARPAFSHYPTLMANYPLKVRHKDAQGNWAATVFADTPEQVRSYLIDWRAAGFTEFDIEDVTLA